MLVTVAGAFLLAVSLFWILLALISALQLIPGVFGAIRMTAGSLGLETGKLLEFNAIAVTAIFVAVQLWLSNRRADAAEATAQAAAKTAESTSRSHVAQRFNDAIAMMESESELSRVGGLQSMMQIATDYPSYRVHVRQAMRAYIKGDGLGQQK